jgi:hypothetical protein
MVADIHAFTIENRSDLRLDVVGALTAAPTGPWNLRLFDEQAHQHHRVQVNMYALSA